MFTIDNKLDIAAPLALVHKAITTEAGYRGWLAEDTDMNGADITFRFSQPSGEVRTVTMRIVRTSSTGIVMECVAHENNSDWLGTTLAIDVAEAAAGTHVHLAHSGYPAMNEVYDRCVGAWQYFMNSLARYATTGVGEPFPKAA